MISFSLLGSSSYGRLGNQLFQIAATIAIAKKNKQDFIFPKWTYSHYFENHLPTGKNPEAKIYLQKQKLFYEIELKPDNENWDLRGFFSSSLFFDIAKSEVRYYLTPKKEVIEQLRKKYSYIFSKKTCSIHIRRGDFLKLKFQYPELSDQFFDSAIAQFEKDTTFVVFSDDINYCKNKFKGEKFVFIENEKDIIDLFLMSMCDNHIISNSTFSWWGAWLNTKESKSIIAPAQWFGPAHSPQYKKISEEITRGFITLNNTTKTYNLSESLTIYFFYYLKNILFYKTKNLIPKNIRKALKHN
ncbi:MAG: alpha-1,2-fucosyltransferase [Bacteroidia bacterium]